MRVGLTFHVLHSDQLAFVCEVMQSNLSSLRSLWTGDTYLTPSMIKYQSEGILEVGFPIVTSKQPLCTSENDLHSRDLLGLVS